MEASFAGLTGRSILIVEDEPLIAMDIAQALESAGASVLLASTLSAGLGYMDEPDLAAAVLDQGLGLDDANELCAGLTARHVPFVVYSGFARSNDTACEAGAYVSKPAGPDALVDEVLALLAQPTI